MQTRMFLTSVSAIAISAGATEVAQAQDAGEAAGYSLSFQGTFGRLDNAPADKWGGSGGPFGPCRGRRGIASACECVQRGGRVSVVLG